MHTAADELQLPPLRERTRRRRGLVVVTLAALGVAAVAFLAWPKPAGERYRTVPLARRSIVRVVDATGRLAVAGRVEVAPVVAGRIVQILVTSGVRVKKGQLLAKLDDRAQHLALGEARAGQRAAAGRVAEARIARDAAVEEQRHIEQLVPRGLASAQDAVAARTAADRAAALLAAAQAEEAAASERAAAVALGDDAHDIVAPTDGIVLKAPETVGMMVDSGHGPLFVIGASLDTLRVDAHVNEADIAQVRVGQTAYFEVQGLPGRRFDAHVERMALEPDLLDGVVHYPVTFGAVNPDRVLLPGMSVLVHLEVARADNVFAVHEAALRYTPEDAAAAPPRARLWRRVAPARVEPVRVVAGVSDGAFTEMTAADGETLREGDLIAIGLLNPEPSTLGMPSITLGRKP